MSERDDRAERHGRILTELAEIGMAAARRLGERIEAAESDVELERLSRALNRVSRCVRLTLALETRLESDRRRASRDEHYDRQKAVEHRRKQVDHAISGQIYVEREGEDNEALFKEFYDILDEQSLYDAFLDKPLPAVIARLRRDLGLAPLADNDANGDEGKAVGDGLAIRAGPLITARIPPAPARAEAGAQERDWDEDDDFP